MTGPALRLLDPKRELSADAEDDFRAAAAAAPARTPEAPSRAIVVAPQDEQRVDALIAIAEPLARSQPPRELILARLLEPASLAAGLVTESRELGRATVQLDTRRKLLLERGVAARAIAFTSPDRGSDFVRLASREEVDLILVNGRRPLLGEPIPGGAVGTILAKAPCDVAVLIERDDLPTIDADHPVVVPFGGSDHDWSALELGAWIAFARQAPLKLLGAAYGDGDGRDASRLLANASLVTQQLAGVATEPVLARPGPEILEAAKGAGILVVGLSDRWKEEGLGQTRSEIAKSGVATTLFIRRGERAGALGARSDMTRFAWSTVGPSAFG
jgi:hypothetical protein